MSEELTALGLVADLRKALGDPLGRLMQDELVAHAVALVAERDRLRADVRELVECLAESTEDTGECLTHHLQAYGETYKPQRAADYRAQIVKARALLAKHRDPLQALDDNAAELGMTYEDGSKT